MNLVEMHAYTLFDVRIDSDFGGSYLQSGLNTYEISHYTFSDVNYKFYDYQDFVYYVAQKSLK